MTRDDFIGEVDQALAALRRVIVRAIDAPSPFAPAASKPPAAPVPAAPPPSSQLVSAAGIEIDISERTVTFRGAYAMLSRRQVQLAAVLAKASPNFISRPDATARAWPDIAAASREAAVSDTVRSMADKLISLRLKVEAVRGYGLRMWAIEDSK